MYSSKLFLLMMDLLNLETPLENPGYAPMVPCCCSRSLVVTTLHIILRMINYSVH